MKMKRTTRQGRDELATRNRTDNTGGTRSGVIREACWVPRCDSITRGACCRPACMQGTPPSPITSAQPLINSASSSIEEQRVWHQPNRNLLVRKLDLPQTWNLMVKNYLRATGFYHVSKIGGNTWISPVISCSGRKVEARDSHLRIADSSGGFVQSQSYAIFGREPKVSNSSKSYIKLAWVRRVRDAEPLDNEDSVRRYVRCHIFCLLGSTLFADKSTAYAHAKYLPLLRDFDRIHTYSWGWSHSARTTAWSSNTVVTFRHHIDYMQEFEWRPYAGLIIPNELHGHLDVCDTVAPLLSFECIEWHPVDRVMRQFGYTQPPPQRAREIPLDLHCMALRGVQLHDWTVLHGAWIGEWGNRRNTRLRYLHPLPTWDFSPTTEYRDWYLRSYRHLLRLSEYVPQDPQPPVPQPPAPQDHRSTVMVAITVTRVSPAIRDVTVSTASTLRTATTLRAATTLRLTTTLISLYLRFHPVMIGLSSLLVVMEISSHKIGPTLVWVGHGSDPSSATASCDSGFHRRAYTVVDDYNPGASAPTEAGGSFTPAEAGGSVAPAEGGGLAASGHPYDLRTERNPPDRYTPSRFGQGMMGKGLNWMAGKK
ncbi:uncharacterized protein DS421_13g409050 [Arachis hypogaea]|nr:uncharacterized protein DS421_13g409050 [Arachis hypogaea]